MTLGEREYLSVGQAARLFGHGPEFWRERFDAGDVQGYRYGRRQDRHLSAASCRAYLAGLAAPAPERVDLTACARRRMADWIQKRAAQGATGTAQKPNN